ncbi:MAG: pyruvate kinase [Marinilabiliales bacterium]|nr:pyruvate kinase [Marinilabiliales bacterium]
MSPAFFAACMRQVWTLYRINSAHLDPEGVKKIVANVRSVSDKIAILLDTKGPEIRTTDL